MSKRFDEGISSEFTEVSVEKHAKYFNKSIFLLSFLSSVQSTALPPSESNFAAGVLELFLCSATAKLGDENGRLASFLLSVGLLTSSQLASLVRSVYWDLTTDFASTFVMLNQAMQNSMISALTISMKASILDSLVVLAKDLGGSHDEKSDKQFAIYNAWFSISGLGGSVAGLVGGVLIKKLALQLKSRNLPVSLNSLVYLVTLFASGYVANVLGDKIQETRLLIKKTKNEEGKLEEDSPVLGKLFEWTPFNFLFLASMKVSITRLLLICAVYSITKPSNCLMAHHLENATPAHLRLQTMFHFLLSSMLGCTASLLLIKNSKDLYQTSQLSLFARTVSSMVFTINEPLANFISIFSQRGADLFELELVKATCVDDSSLPSRGPGEVLCSLKNFESFSVFAARTICAYLTKYDERAAYVFLSTLALATIKSKAY